MGKFCFKNKNSEKSKTFGKICQTFEITKLKEKKSITSKHGPFWLC